MHTKLHQYFGMVWLDEFYRLQNEGYSEDGAIVKCYNTYFVKNGK